MIESLVQSLEDAERLKNSKTTQEKLRKFVIDTSTPLDRRFKIWSRFCNKKEENWIIHKGEYGIIGHMVDQCWPMDYDRYREYTFEDFLRFVEDYNDDKESYDQMVGVHVPPVDQFKEMLIESNFGSFTMDW